MKLILLIFVLLLAVTIIYFVTDCLQPPTNLINVNVTAEVLKVVSSFTLQLSFATVFYLLIKQARVNEEQHLSTSTLSKSASSYMFTSYKDKQSIIETGSFLQEKVGTPENFFRSASFNNLIENNLAQPSEEEAAIIDVLVLKYVD